MTILFKSKSNDRDLISIKDSQVMLYKTPEEVKEYYESMKYEEVDEEGNIIGYFCGNYMIEEDFNISVAKDN